MVNENPERRPDSDLLFVAFLLITLGLFFFVFYPPPILPGTKYQQIPLSIEKGISLNKVLKLGKQDNEHENLLAKIRKDLAIPYCLEVRIFVGPYADISGEGQLVDTNQPFGFVLLLDERFYNELNPEEKIALIGHELGHLTNERVFMVSSPDIVIKFQIEADTYSTKYARPEAMMSVLNKANARHGDLPSRQYQLRMESLEKIKQSKQGQ